MTKIITHDTKKFDAYHINRDMLLGLFVPGCDTTREIGATRIVPGSQLWGDEQRAFGPSGDKGVIDAELKASEALSCLVVCIMELDSTISQLATAWFILCSYVVAFIVKR